MIWKVRRRSGLSVSTPPTKQVVEQTCRAGAAAQRLRHKNVRRARPGHWCSPPNQLRWVSTTHFPPGATSGTTHMNGPGRNKRSRALPSGGSGRPQDPPGATACPRRERARWSIQTSGNGPVTPGRKRRTFNGTARIRPGGISSSDRGNRAGATRGPARQSFPEPDAIWRPEGRTAPRTGGGKCN